MIAVQSVVNSMAARLDAADSDYYRFDRDYLPAILDSQRLLVSLVDSLYAEKRLSEEIFQDLLEVRVFQTSTFSRIQFTSLAPSDVWTIVSVEPLPTTSPVFTASAPAFPNRSFYRSDLAHVTSSFSADRTTIEERNRAKTNPFAAGHDLETGETAKTYGYLLHNDYSSDTYTFQTNRPQEIEVFPFIPLQPVTIRYAKVPSEPATISDSLEFPLMFQETITQGALLFISVKQGDGTTVNSISNQMLSSLLQTIQ